MSPTRLFSAALCALALAGCASTGATFPDEPSEAERQPTCHDAALNYREALEAVVYPPQYRDKRVSGWVLVGYELDGSGVARNLRVLKSSPSGAFESAALRPYSEMRFKPDVKRAECRALVGFKVSKAG